MVINLGRVKRLAFIFTLMSKIIVLLCFVSFSMKAQTSANSDKNRKMFFYSSASLQYHPRLKPVDVSNPELFYRWPIVGNGLGLIGVAREFHDGKYALGINLGIESQEVKASEGDLIPDPSFDPSLYYPSYFIEQIYEPTLLRSRISVEGDYRFTLNNQTDCVFGGYFGLAERYPGHVRISAYPLRMEGYIYDVSPFIYGFKSGILRNNWEATLRFEKIYVKSDYTLFSLNNQFPDLNDSYARRQYFFVFEMRYYYGRKKHSFRYK